MTPSGVIREVRKIVSNQLRRRTRVQRQQTNIKAAEEAFERELAALRQSLKK